MARISATAAIFQCKTELRRYAHYWQKLWRRIRWSGCPGIMSKTKFVTRERQALAIVLIRPDSGALCASRDYEPGTTAREMVHNWGHLVVSRF